MKNTSPVRWLICFLVVYILVIASCTKTETVTISIEEPVASFSVSVPDVMWGRLTPGNLSYIDSSFSFRNTSDSGDKITYRWDFGDGTTSSDRHPMHAYAKRGSYNVTLTVAKEDRAFAKAQQTVSVALGQQHIENSDRRNLAPVAIEETPANEFYLLAATNYGESYSLYLLDSLLKPKSFKSFPAGYRLVSMKGTSDGNLVFTGSTQNIDKANELIKTRPDGTQLWKKELATNDYYSYAAQISDGGYVVVGSRTVPVSFGNNYPTVVIKTDANGNLEWQKLLDTEGLTLTKDAVVEPDGIVVAGIKRGVCMDCDSILVVKLNHDGIVVWKNTVMGALNNSSWSDTRICKLQNGTYAVASGAARGIFFFAASGEFLDRKLAAHPVVGLTSSEDGNIVALQNEWSNGLQARISKIGLDGTQQWTAYPQGWQRLGANVSCCANRMPVAIKPLRSGGTITIGYRSFYHSNFSSEYYAVLMLQLDGAGKPK